MFALCAQLLLNWFALQGVQSPQKGKVLWKVIDGRSSASSVLKFQTESKQGFTIYWFPYSHPWTQGASTMQPWQWLWLQGESAGSFPPTVPNVQIFLCRLFFIPLWFLPWVQSTIGTYWKTSGFSTSPPFLKLYFMSAVTLVKYKLSFFKWRFSLWCKGKSRSVQKN